MGFRSVYNEYEFEKEEDNGVIMEHRKAVTGDLRKGKSSRYKIPVSLRRIEEVLSPICKERKQYLARIKSFLIFGPIVRIFISPDLDGFISSISLDEMIKYLEKILQVKVSHLIEDEWEKQCVKVFNESNK